MQRISSRFFFIFLVMVVLGVGILVEGILRNRSNQKEIIVGSKNVVEQEILGEMIATLLEKKYHFRVGRKFNLEGVVVAFHALRLKDIDILPEYSGTALFEILQEKDVEGKDIHWIRKEFKKRYQIEWMEPFGHLNQFVFLVRKDSPFYTLADIDRKKLKTGMIPDFLIRREHRILKEAYQLFMQSIFLDEGLIYLMLDLGQIQVGLGSSVDGRIDKYDLRELKDERELLPEYIAAPIVRQDVLEKYPKVREALLELKGITTNKEIRKLNMWVTTGEKTAHEVAEEFLIRKGLLPQKEGE